MFPVLRWQIINQGLWCTCILWHFTLAPIMLVNFTLCNNSLELHISTETLQQRSRYEQALAYFNDGKTVAALKKSEAALKEYPGDANLMCLAAKANLVLKRLGKARRLIDEAVRQHPGFAVAHDLSGDLLLIQGHAESAVKAYEQAIRLDPTRSLVLAKIEKALELATDAKKSLLLLKKIRLLQGGCHLRMKYARPESCTSRASPREQKKFTATF